MDKSPKLPPLHNSAMPSGRVVGCGGLGGARAPTLPSLLGGQHHHASPALIPTPACPLWSFISVPLDREFQWLSQLPVSGVLDRATLHQMMRPRCGVADTDSQASWAERISALFAGRAAKMRRKKRFARQGEHCENAMATKTDLVLCSLFPRKGMEGKQQLLTRGPEL